MNEFVLEISALVVTLFCMVDCLRNRAAHHVRFPKGLINKIKDRGYVYILLLFGLMISTMADIPEMLAETYFTASDPLLLDILNEIYFITHTALPTLFALYITDFAGAENKSNLFFAIFSVPLLLTEAAVVSNPFTRFIYVVDEQGEYHRCPGIWLLYVGAGFYVIFGLLQFLINRKRMSKMDRSAMLVILFIATSGIVIQGLFSVKVELFFESIGLLCFLLLLEEKGTYGKKGRSSRISKGFIVIIALIFTTVIVMNITIIYHAGTDQTGRIGETQINNLKGEMQQTISGSENNLLRYSIGLEQLINDNAGLDEIEKYIREQKKYYSDQSSGNCFSVYAASSEWTIIPDFEMPQEYHAVERLWYTGAKREPGQVFISEPYIDANTGDLCYTFSYILSDGDTVAAMDYTLSRVQDIAGRMGGSEDQFAMIVTDDGIVVGCSDESYQGEKISDVLHQYSEVFSRVKASNEHRSFRTTIDGEEKIVFDSETGNGWKLILVVDYGTFYREIINQMIMLGTIDFMMVTVIVAFYLVSVNNQEKAEKTLDSTESFIAGLSGDIKIPLQEIIGLSDSCLKHYPEDGRAAFREILESGRQLQEKLDNLFSYSNILKEKMHDTSSDKNAKSRKKQVSYRYIRNGIVSIIITASLVGLVLCIVMTYNWGQERISKEAERYDSEVTLWMQQKQSILQMFSDVIAADPTVLDDYDSAVKWLDDITKNYNDMTFAYLANPYKEEHQVIMNNGWVPDPDWKVEERQWYIDTERSGSGYSISAPYYDSQTGLYCITFSRSVYSKDGNFLGIFAIDCLLDKLVGVLDNSYTSDSYAFMVDRDGTVINHPYEQYQISTTNSVNIEDTEYADVYHNKSLFLLSDYDGRYSACYVINNAISGFSVVVVQNWWSIYGTVLVIAIVYLVLIAVSTVCVVTMINRFIRWQEKANEKLVEAAETAVAAEKAKSRFLAQMSHEIRTPINAVLGMNEMILRESSDSSIKEYAGNIHSAGRNLLGLINTILDFSKIEEGKMEIIPVKYDTSTFVENLINSISARAADKGLVFEPHIDSTLPSSLYGDDMRVSQVAVNLLTNAVKYTREGRVDMFIDGIRTGDESIALRVRVKDTGIGIKQEDIGRMFESFTRLEEDRNRTIEGTGLGMAIVNKLLDMMGSKLEVESVYGEGSEFAFEVIQGIIDDSPIGDYAEKARKALSHEESGKTLFAPEAKLLVVDDNDMNIKVAKNLLKLNGIVPDTSLSGADALDKLKNKTYDIVLLDHMMPEMDGIETLEKAKEQGLIPDGCYVVVLTANAVVGARESYLESGFDDYLSKPIEVKALESILGKYLPQEKVSYKSKEEEKTADPHSEAPAEVKEPTAEDNASGTPADGDEALLKLLAENGFDTDSGLNYCGGDPDFYREILSEFLESAEMRRKELDDALAADNIKNYEIKVHALKSTARTIGAAGLSEAAAALEKAAKAGETDTIHSDHPGLCELLDKVVDALNAAGMSSGVQSSDDDDEIMEFRPE